MTNPSMGRRSVLAIGAGATAATALGAAEAQAAPERRPAKPAPSSLRFRRDGSFTVLQFNDTQDAHLTDKRTIELITRAIAKEEPDFVVFNGDIINGDPATAEQVKQAYNNVIAPVEEAGVAWALTFGNHDEDSVKKSGMTENRIMDFLRRYPHNLNVRDDATSGHANVVLPVAASRGRRTAAAMWLLDSGRYEKETLDGQKVEEYTYETVHSDQVAWYREESLRLQKQAGRPVPGRPRCPSADPASSRLQMPLVAPDRQRSSSWAGGTLAWWRSDEKLEERGPFDGPRNLGRGRPFDGLRDLVREMRPADQPSAARTSSLLGAVSTCLPTTTVGTSSLPSCRPRTVAAASASCQMLRKVSRSSAGSRPDIRSSQ